LSPQDLDWTGVPAERAPEILRRIRILESFLALKKPTPVQRAEARKSLGVGRAMFYRMLGIWRESRKPSSLPGARIAERGGRGGRRLAKVVEGIITDVIQSEGRDAAPEAIVAEVRRRCAAASVKAPNRETIRQRRRAALP
jgi:hypothetical protein